MIRLSCSLLVALAIGFVTGQLVGERSRAPSGVAVAPAAPREPESRAPETEENIAAASRARSVLDHAFRVGRWTDEDAASMRALMGQLSPEAEREVLTALVAALNDPRLDLATMGGPL
jgi:hypothetical protein